MAAIRYVRRAYRRYSSSIFFKPIDKISSTDDGKAKNAIDVAHFRQIYFEPSIPVLLQGCMSDAPATSKWFIPSANSSDYRELNLEYLWPYGPTLVPIEVTRAAKDEHGGSRELFDRMEAPLSVFLQYCSSPVTNIRLYLAQCSLSALPADLQKDFVVPEVVRCAGKGDIYDSSVWIGLPPTRTPLHRDPNPNLFVQLAGRKIVRLVSPEAGDTIYEATKREIGSSGHASMRGSEMMSGKEFQLLERCIWDPKDDRNGSEAPECVLDRSLEATLEPGDALFIPKGWWHSVRGVGQGLTASVGNGA